MTVSILYHWKLSQKLSKTSTVEQDCEHGLSQVLLENPWERSERDCSQPAVKPLYNDHSGAEFKELGHSLRILKNLAYIFEIVVCNPC